MTESGGLVIDSYTLNHVIGLIAEWDKSDRYAAVEYANGRVTAGELERRIRNAAYMKARADYAVELLELLGLDAKYTRRAMADAQKARGING